MANQLGLICTSKAVVIVDIELIRMLTIWIEKARIFWYAIMVGSSINDYVIIIDINYGVVISFCVGVGYGYGFGVSCVSGFSGASDGSMVVVVLVVVVVVGLY